MVLLYLPFKVVIGLPWWGVTSLAQGPAPGPCTGRPSMAPMKSSGPTRICAGGSVPGRRVGSACQLAHDLRTVASRAGPWMRRSRQPGYGTAWYHWRGQRTAHLHFFIPRRHQTLRGVNPDLRSAEVDDPRAGRCVSRRNTPEEAGAHVQDAPLALALALPSGTSIPLTSNDCCGIMVGGRQAL